MSRELNVVTLTEFIDNHLTNVMTGGSVLIARITEPHYQPRHNESEFFTAYSAAGAGASAAGAAAAVSSADAARRSER